jgi:RimJ/RimL family protein N-acetyltransferase
VAPADRRAHGRELLTVLKESAVAHGSGLCIPVGTPVRALLRPVATRGGEASADDVARLTEWRNQHATAFLTEFEARDEQTERWLAEIIHPDNTRILLMVDEPDGRTVGHMGLASIDWDSGSFEADAITRGVDAPRGLMGESLQTMLRWGRSQLGLSDAWLRVRSDNPAIGFYDRIGFTELKRVPVERHEEPGMVRWAENPDASGEFSIVYMGWNDPFGTV